MAKWLHDVSAQWAGGLLVVFTLALLGSALAIAYYAYSTLSGPAFATILFCLVVALFCAGCAAVWLRDRFTAKPPKESAPVVRERDGLLASNERLRRQVETQQIQVQARDDQLAALEPLVAWARALIERERGTTMYVRLTHEQIAITNASHLDDPEPYFEIVVPFQYIGTGRIFVGETCSGRLSWDGRDFEREPRITSELDDPLPFQGDGPTGGVVRLRQYVSNDLRDRIKAFTERKPPEMEFWIRSFHISMRIEAYDGEVLAEGEFLPGDYLTAHLRYR